MTFEPLEGMDAMLDQMACEYSGEKLPAYRSGITASALMAMQFEPIRYVVNGYIAEGLTVLAGAPKIGKSWMALNIAIAVASGKPAFGTVPCSHGDVLYLALEDNNRRLRSRISKMGIGEPPERLTLCTSWPSLADGAVQEIEAWANAVKNPVLVFVDVLAKVRDSANGKDSAYDADYRTLTGLQELAGKLGIAIVPLHHTRKMEADDPFDSVSGTRGITGAADTVLVLKRDIGTGRTVLYGRGRDIEEIETAFDFDRDIGTWQVIGAAADFAKTDERQEIRDVLQDAGKALNAREVSDLLGKSYEAVRKTLTRMAHSGEIEKEGRGLYSCPNCPNVPNDADTPLDWDNGTDGTGYRKDPFDVRDDDDGWTGQSPAQSARRRAKP
ncbi:MAG: recombinase A [Croceicoccus sp.]|nr:recombinase A [Croceicoccus sp.]MAL25300.1 recombinase A [Croceicoccus sp.]|tara:strand:+ start:15294 stop:16448 length:1155 start_codon:yes stop_codon:yes gene_type:complete